jgi:ProP effector
MKKQELHPNTSTINRKQKNQSKRAREDALLWLAKTFPLAFDNSHRIQPLKLGIMEEILVHAPTAAAIGISKSKLREAVVLFTRRIDYLTALKAREMRIDLKGSPCVAVTEEEAERAAAKIRKRVEKCAKNARKTLPKLLSQKPNSMYSSSTTDVIGLERGEWINPQVQTPPTSVVIKTKSTRQFDPSAVARLKEKLGLSLTQEKDQ